MSDGERFNEEEGEREVEIERAQESEIHWSDVVRFTGRHVHADVPFGIFLTETAPSLPLQTYCMFVDRFCGLALSGQAVIHVGCKMGSW